MKLFEPSIPTISNNSKVDRLTNNRIISSSKIDYNHPFDLSNIPLNKLRIGYWSTWQVKCGIAVYTEHLINALSKRNIIVFPYNNKLKPVDLLKQIDIDKIHVLNIEYEPAIVPRTPELIALIHELRKRRIKVFLTFHSESDSIKQLVEVIDGAIFHKSPTKISNNKKINIIPMGVPVFEPSNSLEELRKKYNINQEDIVISTTGFMFTWKQHASILELMVPFLKTNSNFKVQLLTAFNDVNPEECIKEENNIKNVINNNNIKDQVIFITDFLPQKELNERLWISNIGYLWSGITTSSSSAASKEFVTSRLPLIITDSNHYHDLQKGIIRTAQNKEEFVKKIFETINNKNLIVMKNELEESYIKYNNDIIISKHLEVFIKS